MKTLKFKKLDDSQLRNIKGGDNRSHCEQLWNQMYDLDVSDEEVYYHVVDDFNKSGCGRYY